MIYFVRRGQDLSSRCFLRRQTSLCRCLFPPSCINGWQQLLVILAYRLRHSNTLCCLLFIGRRGLVLWPWLVGCNFTFFDVSFASYVLCKGRLVVYFVKHFCLFLFLFLLLFYGLANLFNAKILLSLLHTVETLHSLQNLNYI